MKPSLFPRFCSAIPIVATMLLGQPSVAAGPEVHADLERVRSEIQRAWKASDWDGLDRMGSQVVRQYEKDANGFDAYSTFFYVLPNDTSPATRQAYEDWLAKHPDSYAARYARSRYRAYRAMYARGKAFIENIPKAQVKEMQKWFALAEADALASIGMSSRPTLSHFQMMRAARYCGTRDDIDKHYRAAVVADPDVYVVAHEYLQSLQPRWGGSFEALAKFPDQAARQGLGQAKQLRLRREALMLAAWDADLREHDERAMPSIRRLSAVDGGPDGKDIPLFGAFLATIRQGDLDTALKYAEELTATPTATVDQLESVAYQVSKAGRKPEAERLYLKILDRDPKDAYALISLARLALSARRPKDALSYYDRVIGFWPNHAQGLEERARVRITEGLDEPGGVTDAARAAALGLGSAQNYLGYLLWEGKGIARNPGEALYWWIQGAERSDEKALENLDMAERRLGQEYRPLLLAARKRLADARAASLRAVGDTDAVKPLPPR